MHLFGISDGFSLWFCCHVIRTNNILYFLTTPFDPQIECQHGHTYGYKNMRKKLTGNEISIQLLAYHVDYRTNLCVWILTDSPGYLTWCIFKAKVVRLTFIISQPMMARILNKMPPLVGWLPRLRCHAITMSLNMCILHRVPLDYQYRVKPILPLLIYLNKESTHLLKMRE